MSVYNPKFTVLTLDGYEIQEFAEGSDVITVNHSKPDGEMVVGANGHATFIGDNDNSGMLIVKLKQHSANSERLSNLRKRQKRDLATFSPMELFIKDIANGDDVKGHFGFFVDKPPFVRGGGHNETVWTIAFGEIEFDLKAGLYS